MADPGGRGGDPRHRITPVVVGADHAADLSAAARAAGVEIACHWKVDTGMGRLGSLPQGFDEEAVLLNRLPGLRMTGLMSHFAAVEPHRPELAGAQAALFRQAALAAEAAAGRPLMKHLSSSRAFQFHPEWDFDAVRPGILLYGYGCREPGMRCADAPGCNGRGRLVQVEAGADGCAVGCCSPPFRTWRT
ncbi:MAG: alanine racemase [Kiritimatiellia bacterium]